MYIVMCSYICKEYSNNPTHIPLLSPISGRGCGGHSMWQ